MSEMTNLIISQDFIGSCIKQAWDEEMDEEEDDEDDEDTNAVFGITTVINMTSRKESECVKQLKSILLKRVEEEVKSKDVAKKFNDILSDDKQAVGFVINERFVNIPAQISVPMLENLCKEISRANEKQKPFDFAYYVMILKFYRKEDEKSPEDFYSNQEEELFLKDALATFDYSVKSETDSGLSGKWKENDDELTPFRKVILLDGKKFPQLVDSVNAYVNGTN
jgi:protein BCP1